jgi:hypothetical protein
LADVLRVAHALPRRRGDVTDIGPQAGHRRLHVRRRGHAGGGAEEQTRERTGADPERQAREGPGRQHGAEHDGAHGGERDDPCGGQTHRPSELRPDDHDHRDRDGEPHLRVAPASQDVEL